MSPCTSWVIMVTAVSLIVLTMIERGDALECHFCIGLHQCVLDEDQEIETVTCTHEIVRQTNESLAGFMPTLSQAPIPKEPEFQCVHVRATSLSDTTFLFIRGCVYRVDSTEFCDLRYASFRGTRDCVACDDEDRCNDVIVSHTSGVAAIAGGSSISVATAIAALIIGANHIGSAAAGR